MGRHSWKRASIVLPPRVPNPQYPIHSMVGHHVLFSKLEGSWLVRWWVQTQSLQFKSQCLQFQPTNQFQRQYIGRKHHGEHYAVYKHSAKTPSQRPQILNIDPIKRWEHIPGSRHPLCCRHGLRTLNIQSNPWWDIMSCS